jgi:hypothetical protein
MQVVISTFTPHFLLHSCNSYFPVQCLDPHVPKSSAPQSERGKLPSTHVSELDDLREKQTVQTGTKA